MTGGFGPENASDGDTHADQGPGAQQLTKEVQGGVATERPLSHYINVPSGDTAPTSSASTARSDLYAASPCLIPVIHDLARLRADPARKELSVTANLKNRFTHNTAKTCGRQCFTKNSVSFR